MGDDAAQPDDGAFELLAARPDPACSPPTRSILCVRFAHRSRRSPTRLLGRRERAQRVAHLGQPVFDAGERRLVDAGMALAVDALGERADLGFERLDARARHRLFHHQADFGEIVAQRLDRAVDAAGPHRLDPRS